MARERSNFETYSMFYENILQQQHRLLYQKEQVFLPSSLPASENLAARTYSQHIFCALFQELYAVEEDGKQTEVTLSQVGGGDLSIFFFFFSVVFGGPLQVHSPVILGTL